jgi:hypothetical protein
MDVTDDKGHSLWTFFKQADTSKSTPLPVQRPLCDFIPNWQDDNKKAVPVTLPTQGGLATSPCATPAIGRLRNCGFDFNTKNQTCRPGETVTLQVTSDGPSVVRVCEASKVLESAYGVSMDCTIDNPANLDAQATSGHVLANADVNGNTTVTFTCPASRDASETGGTYNVLSAAVSSELQAGNITVTRQ